MQVALELIILCCPVITQNAMQVALHTAEKTIQYLEAQLQAVQPPPANAQMHTASQTSLPALVCLFGAVCIGLEVPA